MIRISRKAFDRLVEEAIASLPEEYAQWIDEVPVIVEDQPGKTDQGVVDDEGGPVGMFVGPALGDERASGDLPPRVMIYRQPLMEACATQEELAEEIRKTLLHELGHYAGLDEVDLDRLGYGDLEEDEPLERDMQEDDEGDAR
jgi:predicted Zn-dependent protease with MMP-like domain